MDRRRFLLTSLAGALAAPLAAEAQQAAKMPRIGVLRNLSPETGAYTYAIRDGLSALGYVEGQNIVIEWRWAHGSQERLADLAAELGRLKLDLIVAGTERSVLTMQKVAPTTPIVFVILSDPVVDGLVSSLARPGGYMTGLTSQFNELAGKRLQLVKEALPNISRLAYLWDPTEPFRGRELPEVQAAARALGLHLQVLEAKRPSDLEGAFRAMAREQAQAVVVPGSVMLITYRSEIAQLAIKARVPVMGQGREYVEAGCLLSYAASFSDLWRRAAYFVDRILKGAKPSDLPVEQPTKFEIVINLKTAKALGLTIPPSVVARADQVIE